MKLKFSLSRITVYLLHFSMSITNWSYQTLWYVRTAYTVSRRQLSESVPQYQITETISRLSEDIDITFIQPNYLTDYYELQDETEIHSSNNNIFIKHCN
jgi:hypothetical protein